MELKITLMDSDLKLLGLNHSMFTGFLTIEPVFQIVGASQKAFSSSGEEQAKACDVMSEALKLLDEEINGKKFFGGEEIGYLDLMLGWIAYWLQVSEENPIIKNNVPPLDELRKTFSLFKRLSVSAEK
ncbi:hypothetical protein Patl1_21131 [Pistacia atlantica]|uniref:Uncharacterized protein n=1 Tax=Pistacia atlantica TaxID=434234 RepID=A0ACC1BIL5_9ROSI|nr:hypothetical protein Patl1_21131 [Pistacia atlantica]